MWSFVWGHLEHLRWTHMGLGVRWSQFRSSHIDMVQICLKTIQISHAFFEIKIYQPSEIRMTLKGPSRPINKEYDSNTFVMLDTTSTNKTKHGGNFLS